MKWSISRLLSVLTVGVVLVAVSASSPAAIVTDFEGLGLAEGTLLSNQIPGLTFQNTLLAQQGSPVFGFQASGGLIDTTVAGEAPFDTSENWFITDIIPSPGDWKTDPGVPIVIQFSSLPVENLGFKIADINGSSSAFETMTAKVFSDLAGTSLLETQTLTNGPSGDGQADDVVFASTGIRRLEIAVNNPQANNIVGFGVDNVSYDPIPEPLSVVVWSLLGLSWFGMNVWRRRRRMGRTPWAEQDRLAIRAIVERGRNHF